MIRLKINIKTAIQINKSQAGETLENKVDRIVNNNEPIKDGAPEIFTERAEGVRASTNIRTDRWEVAIDGTDKISKSYKARREDKADKKDAKGEPTDDKGKEPINQ